MEDSNNGEDDDEVQVLVRGEYYPASVVQAAIIAGNKFFNRNPVMVRTPAVEDQFLIQELAQHEEHLAAHAQGRWMSGPLHP